MPIDPDFLQPGGALASAVLQRALDRLGAVPSELPPGARIGPYRVIEEIGRGGMAVVYRAERADGEFEQTVALKLVRPDNETALTRELLRRERQILANLQHPSIARLLDGGRADDGRLWFALEFVNGTRIDRYCRERRLGRRERLMLFLQVCQAVQFAHGRLLIHRDIKPANILVTRDGAAKLLDFGIARLVDAGAPANLAERALTPGYASPEQARGEAVTTASDIYQLGNLLRQLLAPEPDDAGGDATATTLTAATRLMPLGDAAPADAAPRSIARDLDAIVAKATRAEPERRYATVAELAGDIDNFLARRPVLARAGGRAYRLVCFVNRYRYGVAAAALVAALLVGGAIAVAWQAGLARAQAARAQAVQTFLIGLFDGLDPAHGAGRDVTVRELLARGERDAANRLEQQPELKLVMLGVLGDIYNKLEYAEPAQRLQQARIDLANRLFGADSEAYDAALFGAATAGIGTRANLDAAERDIRNVVAWRERHFGADSTPTLEALHALAKIDNLQDKRTEATQLYGRLLSAYAARYGAHSFEAARMRMGLLENRSGGGYSWKTVLPDVLEVARNLPEPTPEQRRDWYSLQSDIGIALMYAGEWHGSEAALRRSIDGLDRLLGPENGSSIDARRTLGVLYQDSGRYAQALEQFRIASAVADHAYGHDHSEAALNRGFLTRPLLWLGRYAEAEANQREVRDTIARSPSTEAVIHNGTRATHAVCLLFLRDFAAARAEAEAVLADDRRVAARKLGSGYDLLVMGAADSELGRNEQARAEIAEAVSIMRSSGSQPSLHTAKALIALALAESRGDHAENAAAAIAEARAILHQRVDDDHPLLRVADLAEAGIAATRAGGSVTSREPAAAALTQRGIAVPGVFWPVI